MCTLNYTIRDIHKGIRYTLDYTIRDISLYVYLLETVTLSDSIRHIKGYIYTLNYTIRDIPLCVPLGDRRAIIRQHRAYSVSTVSASRGGQHCVRGNTMAADR